MLQKHVDIFHNFLPLLLNPVKISLVKVKMAVMKSSGFSEYSTSEI